MARHERTDLGLLVCNVFLVYREPLTNIFQSVTKGITKLIYFLSLDEEEVMNEMQTISSKVSESDDTVSWLVKKQHHKMSYSL